MTEEPQGIINVKKIPGAIVLCMVVLVAVFSISGASFGLVKAQADSLYCSIPTANCQNNYCQVPLIAITQNSDNCNSTFSGSAGGYCPDLNLQTIPAEAPCSVTISGHTSIFGGNNTKRTFSSATFTTYTKLIAANALPYSFVVNFNTFCQASAQVQVGNALTIIDLRIRDLAFNNIGNVWRVGPGLTVSENFTVSYGTTFPIDIDNNGQPALQFAITGAGGSMTIFNSWMICTQPNTSNSFPAG